MNISKNILGWLFIGLIFCRVSPAANQITITTYYPSPYGVYKELRLNPIPTASQPPCNDNLKGTMYYDKDKDSLYVCSKDPASGNTGWIPVPGGDNLYWVLNDSDDVYNINSSGRVGINTTNINPLSGIFVVSHDGTTEDLVVDENNGNVGIGTTGPQEKLDVNGGIKVGNSNGTHPGTIRWTGSEFEGYYPGTGWQTLGGGGGCYVSYSGGCLPGFTNMGSAGWWGCCSYGTSYFAHFRPPGGGCGSVWGNSNNVGEAFVCCQ